MYYQTMNLLVMAFILFGCVSTVSTSSPNVEATATTVAQSEGQMMLVSGDYPPFSGETLPRQGITSQIMRWVFEDMGKPMAIDFKPWERGFQETMHGDYFATFPYVKNAERETQFYFSDPLFTVNSFFFVQADSTLDFTTHEDLTGQRICRPDGWTLYQLKDLSAEGRITLERPIDMDACFKMLQAKRVDIVLVTEATGWATVERVFGSRQGFKKLSNPFNQVSLYLMVSKKYPQSEALLAEFNRSLAKVVKRGDIEKLLAAELK